MDTKIINGKTIRIGKRPTTPDEITRAIFGISTEQLVAEIVENRNGKYDKLYNKERK